MSHRSFVRPYVRLRREVARPTLRVRGLLGLAEPILIAGHTDTSALTAIGNDYGFADVFVRQLRGLGRKGDGLVAISTSGNSENVVRAVTAANEIGIATIALTGQGGGKLRELADIAICVPAKQTNHIQEMHIAIGHYLCGFIEQAAS